MANAILLNNGCCMPKVGLGLWKVDRDTAADQVYQAIKVGYRLLDCASDYGNEREVGVGISRALSEGLVARRDLFVTAKLWCTYHRREHVEPALQRTLQDLGLDYVDLYLVHFPIALKYVPFETRYPPEWSYEPGGPVIPDSVSFQETWQAMELLHDKGLAKSIGISNMSGALIYDLLAYARVRPAVLQIELHPFLVREQLVALAQAEGMAVTAYSSFGDSSYREISPTPTTPGFTPLLTHSAISEIAAAHGSAAVLSSKSSHPERLQENLNLFDFSLTPAEVARISRLDLNLRFNDPANYANRPIWAS